MQIGYARVSTADQDNAAQVTARKSAGCERIYREKASGGRWAGPNSTGFWINLRKGDVLTLMERSGKPRRDSAV